MSYLSRPRIGFIATDAMTNPSTANNENVIHLLDADNVRLLNPPVVKGAELPVMDDASYREWMMSLVTYAPPPPEPTQPAWKPSLPGYWNYYGDHLTTFGSARVNSAWIADQPVTNPADDPLLGATVVFNAKLVDLNPADTFCSQLIAAGLKVVGPDREGQPAELISGTPTVGYTRWLNFFRPWGAGTFQSVIPNDALTLIDESRAPDSPALTALRERAAAGGGLMLRYCLYFLRAQLQMTELYDRFRNGEIAMNPKFGRVLGTIGVWNGSDMISAPVGRVLQQPGPPFFPADTPDEAAAAPAPPITVKSHGDVEQVFTPGTAAFTASQEAAQAATIGPVAAVVEDGHIVLDLLTTFPEAGSPPDPMAKADFGPVNLELDYTDDSGLAHSVVVGPVPYDQHAYESLAGVVEIPFEAGSEIAQHLAQGSLLLRDGSGTVLLREIDTVQVETDDRCVYVDLEPQGDDAVAVGKVALRVFRKGEPIAEPVTLQLEQWQDEMTPGEANSVNPLVVTACAMGDRQVWPGDPDYALPGTEITVPSGGLADVTFRARTPGCYKIRFVAPGMQVDPENPSFAVEYYANYRVLPLDDYSHVSDDKLTWPYVYEEVFSYYAVLYPIMSLIIPWGPSSTPTDPERVAQFAALIRQAVDERRLGTALAMPITRELSAGKRRLVQRWCDRQLTTQG